MRQSNCRQELCSHGHTGSSTLRFQVSHFTRSQWSEGDIKPNLMTSELDGIPIPFKMPVGGVFWSGSRSSPPYYLVMIHSKQGAPALPKGRAHTNTSPTCFLWPLQTMHYQSFPWLIPEQSVYLHRPRPRAENHYLFYLFPCTHVLINLELKESSMRSLSWFAFIICSVMFWAL